MVVSVESMEDEFQPPARKQEVNASIATMVVPDAVAALEAGDAERHNEMYSTMTP